MCSEQKLQIWTPHRPVAGTAGETDRVREGSRAAVPVDAAAGRQQEGDSFKANGERILQEVDVLCLLGQRPLEPCVLAPGSGCGAPPRTLCSKWVLTWALTWK